MCLLRVKRSDSFWWLENYSVTLDVVENYHLIIFRSERTQCRILSERKTRVVCVVVAIL